MRSTPKRRSTELAAHLLEAAHGEAPTTTLYVTSQILCEFYAVVTNARRVLRPRSSADALTAISDMLGFLRVQPVPVTAIDEVIALLRRRPITGGDIFDLQIVATMKLNGVSRIYTLLSTPTTLSPFQKSSP